MKFTYDQANSPAGRDVRKYLDAEIARLREENDKVSNDEKKTQVIRGELSACKKLLACVTYTPPPE